MSEQVRAYLGITITLVTHAVPQNLFALLTAIDPACPPTCRECSIQFDGAQAGAAGVVLVGDALVSIASQRCGVSLSPADAKTYRSDGREVYLNSIWLVASTLDNCFVNIEVQN